MFGIGMPELIIIMVIALIVIGPSKLPDLARAIGKGLAEFRKASQEIKESLNIQEEINEAKTDLIDSISGLKEPLDLESTQTPAEKTAYETDGDRQADIEKQERETRTNEEGVIGKDPEKRNGQDGKPGKTAFSGTSGGTAQKTYRVCHCSGNRFCDLLLLFGKAFSVAG